MLPKAPSSYTGELSTIASAAALTRSPSSLTVSLSVYSDLFSSQSSTKPVCYFWLTELC